MKTVTGKKITMSEGLAETGNYNLTIKGHVYDADNNRVEETREFGGYIQITGESVGALPKILTFTANGKEADITISTGDTVRYAYTGRKADGAGSQGVDLLEKRFGVKCGDLGIEGGKSFSTAFWLKINQLAPGETQLLAVAYKLDAWPKTDWGWIWVNINEDGSMGSFTFRGTAASYGGNNELRYKFDKTKIPVGSWFHLAFTFDYDASGKLLCHFYVNGIKQELTRWNRSKDGDTYYNAADNAPGYQPDIYKITASQVLSVGGSAHGRAGIDGIIDNFQVWDKVMSEDDVKTSMGDLDANNLPAGLAAYWDLETAASSRTHTFKSVGTKAKVNAGMHDYTSSGGEGQGVFTWIKPTYTSGSPFISGTAFPVITKPSLKIKKARILECDGNDTEGAAAVWHNNSGDYVVTLSLTNSLGSDQRTFQVIKVEGEDIEDGIDEVIAENFTTYTINGIAFVEFAQAGNYNVSLYTVAGKKVAEKAAAVTAGNSMQIAINAEGTYILTIEKDGKIVRSVKLYNK